MMKFSPRNIVFLFAIFSTLTVVRSQQLTSKQEAWLYRIVHKTPVLKANWEDYFEFDEAPFQRQQPGELLIDYNAITYYQQHSPESLKIDYKSIESSSPGLIAEATIKLTLWELNEELKRCIYQPNNCNDSIFNWFRTTLETELKNAVKNRRLQQAIQTIVHPSLPIFKKLEDLEKFKVDPSVQKEVMNQWGQLVTSYCQLRSQYFFSLLSNGKQIENSVFLAAGEGSGTAGLLYEKEINPADSTLLWYGKGIGLFTYQLQLHKNTIRLKDHMAATIRLPKNEQVAIHTSLWGLNSSFKPMLIITDDTVSYHLFADFESKSLSADVQSAKGISHLDRIEQYRETKIIKPLRQLQAESSLNTILSKELNSKDETEAQIHQLEAEIDTFLKYDPGNVNAIDYRKRQIDSKLSILTNKERRIKELDEKLIKQNRAIIRAEKRLKEMIELCGPNVQSCRRDGYNYIYPTGVNYNSQTQDLIFPASPTERELKVSLLSASYSLEGQQKDEVQAYLSVTEAPFVMVDKPVQPAEIDTTITYYFHPDAYQSYTNNHFDTTLVNHLKQFTHLQVSFDYDSTRTKAAKHQYANRQREYKLPLTADGRKRNASIQLYSQSDTLNIIVKASSDAVASRLSQVPDELRKALKITGSSRANNSYLEAFRALQTLQSFLENSQLSELVKQQIITYKHPHLIKKHCELIQRHLIEY